VGGMDNDVAMLDGALSEGALVTDVEVMGAYRRDRADIVPAGVPRAVVRAFGVADVSATLSWANRHGVAVVPRGAGTGLSGGANAIDGCIVLSLERLTAIREIDRAGQYAIVEAGVINADLGRAAAAAGLFYPPDPGSFEICSIGGNLATNAGGMRCVKYGVTRDSALSLEVVLADGTVINTGSRSRKNVAGYDLTSLFIGSEGTLGVITAATLRLRPAPVSGPLTFVASFPTLGAAGDAVAAIQAAGIVPSLLELMDNRTINAVEDYRRLDLDRRSAALLIGQADGPAAEAEASGMIGACTASGADFAIGASDAAESDMLLEARRLAGPALMATGPTVIEDVGVPPGQLRAMLEYVEQVSRDSGLPIGTCAHAGDGNLHPTMLLPDLTEATIAHALDAGRRLCDHAVELGGTITGEHGVGVLKRSWLRGQLSPEVLAVHHAIKVALDPRNVLNPGRSF
jgi:glycolate dehydrogenase FAD-linked subunit